MDATLLIVDDHEMVREGLRHVFAGTEFRTVEAPDGESALRMVEDEAVHVVLLDIEMRGIDGLEVLRRIRRKHPDVPVLMHSGHDLVAYVGRSIDLGAAGYIIKSPLVGDLIDAVRAAYAGGTVWTPAQLQYAAGNQAQVR